MIINIIYFYSIVSFLPFPKPHVRIGLMLRCYAVTVLRLSKAMSNEQLAVSKEGRVRELGVFAISVFISILIFDLQIYNLFRTHQLPRRFSFPPLIRYTATSLLIAHCSLLIALHRYTATSLLIAHCSLLIALHRYTATPLHL